MYFVLHEASARSTRSACADRRAPNGVRSRDTSHRTYRHDTRTSHTSGRREATRSLPSLTNAPPVSAVFLAPRLRYHTRSNIYETISGRNLEISCGRYGRYQTSWTLMTWQVSSISRSSRLRACSGDVANYILISTDLVRCNLQYRQLTLESWRSFVDGKRWGPSRTFEGRGRF